MSASFKQNRHTHSFLIHMAFYRLVSLLHCSTVASELRYDCLGKTELAVVHDAWHDNSHNKPMITNAQCSTGPEELN